MKKGSSVINSHLIYFNILYPLVIQYNYGINMMMYLLTLVTFQFATVKSPEKPCRMRGCFSFFCVWRPLKNDNQNRYDEGSLRNQRSTAHNSDKYGYIIYHNMLSRFRMFMFIFFLPMLTHRPVRIWQFGVCWSKHALNCLSSLVWSWLAIMPCWDILHLTVLEHSIL